jgi:hypothetical protein
MANRIRGTKAPATNGKARPPAAATAPGEAAVNGRVGEPLTEEKKLRLLSDIRAAIETLFPTMVNAAIVGEFLDEMPAYVVPIKGHTPGFIPNVDLIWSGSSSEVSYTSEEWQ